jgi:hypothetical protein
MQEKEIWGVLTEQTYNEIQTKAIKDFGKGKPKKRLAISYWNPEYNKDLDTRIRVTNGLAEVVQKFGEWENVEIVNLREITIPINNDIETIMNMHIVLDNAHPKAPRQITQFENEVFIFNSVELKLTKQLGKVTKYTFELELLDNNLDLLKIAQEYSLRDKITQTNVAFWEKWNKEVNVLSDEISLDGLRKLVEKYLIK